MVTDLNKILEMSDEDISNMSSPPEEKPVDPTGSTQEAPVDDSVPEEETEDTPQLLPVPGSEDKPDDAYVSAKEPESVSPDAKLPPATEPVGETPPESDKPEGDTTATQAAGQAPEALADFYNKIMTPFKANGKMIELRSPEEAIQLMQMGANYTKKLQDLQPHRKVLLMLENNGLLDEGKLSFLIDVERKDPEAIKKLLKDSGVDPMEIDTSEDPAYLGGNHQVSDEEVGFRTALDEVSSTPTGAMTITEINTNWDQASKEVLWQSPGIMTVIHEQRENGVYDVIKAEVDRQMTLGHIPPNTPFLEAYKVIGDSMAQQAMGAANNGDQATGTNSPGQAPPQVIATRAATPKSSVRNDDRASAASPTRGSPKVATQTVNPLAESDEAFLKRMENRL